MLTVVTSMVVLIGLNKEHLLEEELDSSHEEESWRNPGAGLAGDRVASGSGYYKQGKGTVLFQVK